MATENADYNRPRRPASDTVSYLRSLPLDLEVALDEIKAFQGEGLSTEKSAEHGSKFPFVKYPPTLAAALQAIYEIRHEVASLAGDENAAETIEILCRIVIPVSLTAARMLLHATQSYGLHLATHRYGSHVLQTILQLTAKALSSDSSKNVDLALLFEDAPPLPVGTTDLASSSDLILGLAHELEPAVADLAIHICGSHVLRTILCFLGGVEMVSNSAKISSLWRGKVKRKRNKEKDVGNDGAHHSGERMFYLNGHTPNVDMKEALSRLTTTLTVNETSGPGDLQRWACHSSAGPVLTVLLHVLTYQDAASENDLVCEKQIRWEQAQLTPDRHLCEARPEFMYSKGSEAHQVVQRLLCWRNAEEKKRFGADVMYGLAGEPCGSLCLETIFRLSPDDVYADLLDAGKLADPMTMREYVEDDVSNFVVQTVLQTIKTAQQAASILEALEPAMSYILDPSNKRRGILWRMVELTSSETGKQCQGKVLQMICNGFSLLKIKHGVSEENLKVNKCISPLLNMKKPDRDGDRVVVDVAGTRALYNMLRFEPVLCRDTLIGVTDELASEEIELLAKDALGSRCVLDGILEGPVVDPIFASALSRLVIKLRGRWVAVATDRVGHHTVKKVFRALRDMKDKESLVHELVEGKNRMNGNSMGRSVLDALEVHIYETKGEKEWSKAIKKNVEKEEWLKEIVATAAKTPKRNQARKADCGSSSKKARVAHL